MKKAIKILSVMLIALAVLTSVPSCAGNSVAMKIGDYEVTKEEYAATAMSIKTQFITDNDLEESEDLWDQYIDDSYTYTVQQYLDSMIQTYLISYNLYAIHFDELGLTLDEETEKGINETLDTYIAQYGSKEALDEALKTQGFTYEIFKNQYYNDAKKNAVIMHYFGTDSEINPVKKDTLLEYYREYYTKVKHVFLSTKDDEGNDLSKPEKEEIGKNAQNIYNKAMAGEDFDKLISEYGEDPGMTTNPDGYIFSTEDTSYNTMFYNAAFDMKANEIRLIQTNLGYHIMKKYEFTEDELLSDGNEVNLIENMMSEEIADLLEELKEELGVEYNNTLLEELSVVNLAPVNETEENSELNSILDSIGMTVDGEELEE